MNIHPIHNNADYQQTLAEIEALFEVAPNTPEGDLLDVLTTLVEIYEARTIPIPPPGPIDAIVYTLESRGLGRRDLEGYLGVEHESRKFLTARDRCHWR